ncbi:type IV pilus major pilin [Enterobacter sichuanensis]|uniref:type IV pilus major pilin n=1 Tax=Enterobacter TaxID=547 RepID=UPI000BA89A33|nr:MULTISPECIES: type IV pilus major pilin [Enterobacter]PAN69258.1 type IV pilin [Enterobacter cloacae]MCM7885055.1 type IV pilus major pilin [Enterobacter sichuanensis]MCU6192143.1 type IV pilus major pilin [Enterobacter sichuanensis]MCX4179368.1 type IV pilus major pilin [Enterobacter sp. HSTU-ASh6]HDT1602864.1 type IV pilus major pilin [Enterobacter sichuanensis]
MNTLILDLKGNVARKVAQVKEMRKQRGVTLLEIIIVLGIIGVIAAGVVILAQRAFTAQDLSAVQDDLTSVRTAMNEAYKDQAEYPAQSDSILALSKSTIGDTTIANNSPIATLVRMGKISADEAFNGFSNDAFQIDNALTDSSSSQNKGFVVLVNGLASEECRNLISQMGNQWDYVETIKSGAAAGSEPSITGKDLSVAKNVGSGILKTLTSGEIAPADIVTAGVCDGQGSINGVIFGSK